MSGKTELRQATLISEQKVVPGTGTLTGITVSAPITGGGAGPVVPIGATQADDTHAGFIPAGWFHDPLLPVHGGTGADLSGAGAGEIPFFDTDHFATSPNLSFAATPDGDSATSTLTLKATDSNLNESAVSWGIELPGDGTSPGDAILGGIVGERSLLRVRGNAAAGTLIDLAGPDGFAPNFGSFVSADLSSDIAGMGWRFTPGADDSNGTSYLNIKPLGSTQADATTLYLQRGQATAGPASFIATVTDEGSYGPSIGPGALLDLYNPVPGGASGHFQVFEVLENYGTAGVQLHLYNDSADPSQGYFTVTDGVVDATLISMTSTGKSAIASIGSGDNGTVNISAVTPGIIGNSYIVTVAAAAGANDDASAAFVSPNLTVTLGKTSGTLDPAKNTATIIAGLIVGLAADVTATASGTGADPLTGAEGPTTFANGAESITTAGGITFGGTTTLLGSNGAAFFGTTDPTMFAGSAYLAPLNIKTDPATTFNGLTLADSKASLDALAAVPGGAAVGLLNLIQDQTAIGPTLATFYGTDVTGGTDYVNTAWGAAIDNLGTPDWAKGLFEFQHSGTAGAGGFFDFAFQNGIQFRFNNTGEFVPQNDDAQDLGAALDPLTAAAQRWRTGYFGTGIAAVGSIGSGDNGTVALASDAKGVVGNAFTVEVGTWAPSLSHAMTAAYTDKALLVKLGTDGAGVEDATKNTATLIAGAINTAAGGLTATASGTGATPLTAADIGGPTNLSGGAESVTSAGGLSFAGTGIYLPNLPASDPGVPGLLYRTAGAVMVSV